MFQKLDTTLGQKGVASENAVGWRVIDTEVAAGGAAGPRERRVARTARNLNGAGVDPLAAPGGRRRVR